MTSYTLSPFLLTRIQADGEVMDFYFLVLLKAAYVWVFSHPWIQIRSLLILKLKHSILRMYVLQRLLSSVDNLCKQFGPRSGPTAGQDRMQVLNSHGQENQFFNDHHKTILLAIIL